MRDFISGVSGVSFIALWLFDDGPDSWFRFGMLLSSAIFLGTCWVKDKS